MKRPDYPKTSIIKRDIYDVCLSLLQKPQSDICEEKQRPLPDVFFNQRHRVMYTGQHPARQIQK